jgi:EAL domain-containing protein (putative c-di-GMP-specific phosphodiesterase class I)
MITTAEGVETAEQPARLQIEGCTEIQGFYMSPPCPISEVGAILAGNKVQRELA